MPEDLEEYKWDRETEGDRRENYSMSQHLQNCILISYKKPIPVIDIIIWSYKISRIEFRTDRLLRTDR